MASLDQHIARLRGRGYSWSIPWEAVELIARAESCELVAYLCPAGIWTIGWGETAGGTIRKGMRWSEEQADARFFSQIEAYTERIAALVSTDTTGPNELGAMVSLAYNIGAGAFERSSVRKLHNAGQEAAAARAFGLWNKARDPATGQLRELAGLTRRRAAEAALYLRPEPDTRHERMPQAIAPESKLAASPIVQGSAASAAGSAVLAAPALAPVLEQVHAARGVLDSVRDLATQAREFLGFDPLIIVGALAVAGALWAWKWRAAQRAQGWA